MDWNSKSKAKQASREDKRVSIEYSAIPLCIVSLLTFSIIANQSSSSHAARIIEYSCPRSYSSHTFRFLLLLLRSTQLVGTMPTAESPVLHLLIHMHATVHTAW